MNPTKAFLAVVEAHMSDHPACWRAKTSMSDWRDEIVNDEMSVIIERQYGSVSAVKVNNAVVNVPLGWTGRLSRAVNTCLAKQAIAKFKARESAA